MNISVVIPAYNEEKYIGNCIASVLKHKTEGLLEILVIDNASTDKTAEVAAQFAGVRVVSEPQKGLTKARQRGLLEAKGELLAFIDADSIVTAGWFNTINREFLADPNLVCLSGPYIYYDTPKWQQWAVKYLYYGLLARLVYFFTHYMVTGGNFAAKKQALENIGGFDTSIEFYGEDTDIARRLNKQGKVKFVWNFTMLTSARRFAGEGTLKTGMNYAANYTSVMLTQKPAHKKYKDIR